MPVHMAGTEKQVRIVLLSPVNPAYRDSDIDTNLYMVTIYATRDDRIRDKYDPVDLIRIGDGTLHSNVKDAIKASPKGLI